MKKCQVTLFIIGGVVVLAIALFSIFVFNYIKKEKTEENMQVNNIRANVEPITNYLESCIENLGKKGIFLLSSQGGIIFSSQGGLTKDFSTPNMFIQYSSPSGIVSVPYLIELPLTISDCDSTLPSYPLRHNIYYPYGKEGDFDDPNYLSNKIYPQQYCFGKQHIRSLNSMLFDLSGYVENHISECDIKNLQGFTIVPEKPKVSISVSGTDTVINLEYPLDITERSSGAHLKMNNFRKVVRVSMSGLHDFVKEITELDVNDPNYALEHGIQDSHFQVSIDRDVKGKDDLITVTSSDITLDNEPLKFNFARRNRAPALEYVYDLNLSAFAFEENYGVNYLQLINQQLAAVDPDEDNVTIKVNVGKGIFQKTIDESTPYYVTAGDINNGYIALSIEATDGEYTDSQEWMIKP